MRVIISKNTNQLFTYALLQELHKCVGTFKDLASFSTITGSGHLVWKAYKTTSPAAEILIDVLKSIYSSKSGEYIIDLLYYYNIHKYMIPSLVLSALGNITYPINDPASYTQWENLYHKLDNAISGSIRCSRMNDEVCSFGNSPCKANCLATWTDLYEYLINQSNNFSSNNNISSNIQQPISLQSVQGIKKTPRNEPSVVANKFNIPFNNLNKLKNEKISAKTEVPTLNEFFKKNVQPSRDIGKYDASKLVTTLNVRNDNKLYCDINLFLQIILKLYSGSYEDSQLRIHIDNMAKSEVYLKKFLIANLEGTNFFEPLVWRNIDETTEKYYTSYIRDAIADYMFYFMNNKSEYIKFILPNQFIPIHVFGDIDKPYDWSIAVRYIVTKFNQLKDEALNNNQLEEKLKQCMPELIYTLIAHQFSLCSHTINFKRLILLQINQVLQQSCIVVSAAFKDFIYMEIAKIYNQFCGKPSTRKHK